MLLAFSMAEALGVAFGAGIVMLSLCFLYKWAIKPEREQRRQNAFNAVEEMHHNWRELRTHWATNERITKTTHQKHSNRS